MFWSKNTLKWSKRSQYTHRESMLMCLCWLDKFKLVFVYYRFNMMDLKYHWKSHCHAKQLVYLNTLKLIVISSGSNHSSKDPFVPAMLLLQVWIPSTWSMFFHSNSWNWDLSYYCNVKRMEIKKETVIRPYFHSPSLVSQSIIGFSNGFTWFRTCQIGEYQ